ncbi:MAG: RsmB/NOP family class I SAM-dependent RNA methyltransferase [Anaerolineae bacterium]|nr:RsmB/NOP family class I SAM-dependent RNA methyltransferase [Anaerolineae bacterium]MDW8070234.1 RsmB/NOP family class I SAM-dependent RNA methyltransferase [Anaerolineae bacterium]
MTEQLPVAFVTRMRALLGAEAEDFLDSINQSPHLGLRVNTLKVAPETFRSISPFSLEPVPWCPEGFLVTSRDRARPSRHPYYAAGLYYLQEPSAMAVAVLLDPRPGEYVLDLCAAPGGKATHLLTRMQNTGLLVANEVVRSRVSTLLTNLELFGARSILVINETAQALAEHWKGVFDCVLVDAPCSGEGLFRKNPIARREWSPSSVEGCAARQEMLLRKAADLVREGGRLVYSTCTFSPEENEAVVAYFLRARGDYHLVEPPRFPGFSPGRPDWIASDLARGLPLERCVRLWPHLTVGEGHFIAVLEREGSAPRAYLASHTAALPSKISHLVETFWNDVVATREMPDSGWYVSGSEVFWSPVSPAEWKGLRIVRTGWLLGRVARDQFVPSHALAMTLCGADVRRSWELGSDCAAAISYLQGQPLTSSGPEGWVLITYEGYALGWGKRVGMIIKNHYPRHMRWS